MPQNAGNSQLLQTMTSSFPSQPATNTTLASLFAPEKLNRRLVDVSIAAFVIFLFMLGVLFDILNNPMKRSFRYRFTRTLNWIVLGWAKAIQTMTRYSFYALATTNGSTFLNLTMNQYSLVSSLGLWIMPLSLLLNGWIVDKYREQKSFQWGLAGHILWNLLFSLVCYMYQNTTFLTVACFIYYPITCYFQSISEIVINKNNALWYDKNERGIIAGVFTLCLSIGYLLGFAGNSIIVEISQSASFLFLVTSVLLFMSYLSVRWCLSEDNSHLLEQVQFEEDHLKKVKAYAYSHSQENNEEVENKAKGDKLEHLLNNQEEQQQAGASEDRELNELVRQEIQHENNLENTVAAAAQDQQQKQQAAAQATTLVVTDEQLSNANAIVQQEIAEERQKQQDKASGVPVSATLVSNPEPISESSWKDVVFTFDFALISVCFCLIGVIRDGFFVWLNQYLQFRFRIEIGSVYQLLSFSSLTIGSALSAFVSAMFNSIFKDNNFLNGFVCFGLAAVAYLAFGASQHIIVTIFATGAATTMILAVLGIRRILSMTLGGYHHTGLITGILGAATFLGGGIGSITSKVIIQNLGYVLWGYSLSLVAVGGTVLFLIGAVRANEFKHICGEVQPTTKYSKLQTQEEENI